MTVYIAGPMAGIKDYNYPAFMQTEEKLKADGWKVLNPARIGVIEGFKDWRDYWPINEAMLIGADAIFMLDGWKQSLGATNEYIWAQMHGLTILNADGALSHNIPCAKS